MNPVIWCGIDTGEQVEKPVEDNPLETGVINLGSASGPAGKNQWHDDSNVGAGPDRYAYTETDFITRIAAKRKR